MLETIRPRLRLHLVNTADLPRQAHGFVFLEAQQVFGQVARAVDLGTPRQ